MENAEYFDYENYKKLIAEIGARAKSGDVDAEEDIGYIADHFRNFFAYVNAVCNSEVGIHLAGGSLEGESKRARIIELDKMRSVHHNAAIDSAKAINRIAAFYGIDAIYTGDTSVRRQVASFCMSAVSVLFANRR